mgnify:CR=1 FL=1
MSEPTPNFGGRKPTAPLSPAELAEETPAGLGAVPTLKAALDRLEKTEQREPEEVEHRSRRQTRPDLVEHRARVEKQLEPIEIGDVLIDGRLTQKVVVHKKLVVVFQDLVYKDKVFNAQFIEHSGLLGRAAVLQDSMCVLAVGIKSINGMDLPPMLDDRGKRQYELLEARVDFVSERLSNTFIDLVWNNFSWFLERCVEVSVDDLKNG